MSEENEVEDTSIVKVVECERLKIFRVQYKENDKWKDHEVVNNTRKIVTYESDNFKDANTVAEILYEEIRPKEWVTHAEYG